MKRLALIPFLTISLVVGAQPIQRPQAAASSFPLEEVRLLKSQFSEAMLRDQRYLLNLDPDRLLHMYRMTAGLPSSAKPLGGWEAPDVQLRGHTLGHYLSAVSLMFASTGDQRFKTRALAIVDELAIIQTSLEKKGYHAGYLSAFPEDFFDRVDKRQPVWAPYYTIHKTMAGLFDAYQYCSSQKALEILRKQADWVKFRVDRLSADQQQAALQTEFGGMMEVLENLYGVTGNREYQRIARTFDHKRVLDPLARGEDPLNGLHANTQIPKAIGAARDYELSGEKRYHDIASFFWKTVVERRSFVIGGNSDDEHFFAPETTSKHLGESSTETCNTYNMLKLTRHMFEWEPTADKMDFYERALFNHILSSQDPETGEFCYYVPLRPGAFKTFSKDDGSFWCCVGTGMENHAKYTESIYFKDAQSLYVNLFIPSELKWKERGLTVRQETSFPYSDTTNFTVQTEKPVKLSLKLRYPGWAVSGAEILVNGKRFPISAKPGSFISIEREWKSGDRVSARFPMKLHLEATLDDPKTVAVLYGPVVLAADLGTDGLSRELVYGPSEPQMGRVSPIELPVLNNDSGDVISRIKLVKVEDLSFKAGELRLRPFNQIFDRRYSVYFRLASSSDQAAASAMAKALVSRRVQIEKLTADNILIGNSESENAHQLQGDQLSKGAHDEKAWRSAKSWLAANLKPGEDGENLLTITVRGSEGQPRGFEVLVNGQKLGRQVLEIHPGKFFDFEYRIPAGVVKETKAVEVRIQALPEMQMPELYDLRIGGIPR